MKTLDDLDVEGKRVLVRVDFNVPLEDGTITDDSRIRAALPTLEELRGRGASLVLVSHLGRPKDREPELSLRPAARRLGELLGAGVGLAPAVVGDQVRAEADALKPGGVLMLENVRTSRAAWGRWPTRTSTTPSAPPTAPTPRPRASPTWSTRRPRAGCCSARSRR